MKRIRSVFVLGAAVAMAVPFTAIAPSVRAADHSAAAGNGSGSVDPAANAQASVGKAVAFLKAQQQPDGGWRTDKAFPALTAVVLTGLVKSGQYDAKTDFVKKGYDKLLTYQKDTGGIYAEALANYNTSISVSALAAANDPALKEHLDRAVAFIKKTQWVPTGETGPKGEHITDEKNPWFGGWGYGNHSRPDLSNAHFSIEALKEAGLKEDDPAFKAAMQFVSRCQNNSETNDQKKFASEDGGFIYSPTNGEGDTEAEDYTGPDGRRLWRSYGTMTYAGLKSMLYAGVKKDDPRVKAAVDWIQHNWTLDENPGMRNFKPDNAKNGLFYYFNVFAKALNAYDEPVITDAKGAKHDWRVELIQKLTSTQQPDGSWAGDKRWMESDPVLATAYATMALEEALADLKQHPVK